MFMSARSRDTAVSGRRSDLKNELVNLSKNTARPAILFLPARELVA